jgi:hypothetical protein
VTDAAGVHVRPLAAEDLDEADRICRVAFGTFLGAPEPERFFGDAGMVRTRWRADPGAALAAELGGRLAGSNFAANWGSVGFFGPLTVSPVRPDSGPAPVRLSALDQAGRAGAVAAVRELAGAVRPGPAAERLFGLLIDACHALAAEQGASALVAGANAGRDRAWRALAGRGFRRSFQGVAMHRPNEPGYSTSDSFVIDDWR